MILSAKENGAGLVKSQLYNAEDDKGKPNYDLIKKAELTFDQAKELFDYGTEIGIEVFFSVFGVQYVEWCETIGVKRYKIACGLRDIKILRAVANTNKPIYISTNDQSVTYNEIQELSSYPTNMDWNNRVRQLYCVPDYPANVSDLHLNRVNFNFHSGFSDHTIGIDAAKIALARGAQIVEKHFILDRNSPAPDAPWSMTPPELAELVRWERVCKEAL